MLPCDTRVIRQYPGIKLSIKMIAVASSSHPCQCGAIIGHTPCHLTLSTPDTNCLQVVTSTVTTEILLSLKDQFKVLFPVPLLLKNLSFE